VKTPPLRLNSLLAQNRIPSQRSSLQVRSPLHRLPQPPRPRPFRARPEQRLEDSPILYVRDQITAEQYHRDRAKILANPATTSSRCFLVLPETVEVGAVEQPVQRASHLKAGTLARNSVLRQQAVQA